MTERERLCAQLIKRPCCEACLELDIISAATTIDDRQQSSCRKHAPDGPRLRVNLDWM